MSEEKQFEYAGGEFENDAPYVEESDGFGGVTGTDDLHTILGDLGIIDPSSGFDYDAADSCFSLNAAGSFAAISQPEEELEELKPLKHLKLEDLINIVDVSTPLEVIQVILLLRAFKRDQTTTSPASNNNANTNTTTPTFVSDKSNQPNLDAWFRYNEKLLMQTLSLLGLGLNIESSTTTTESSSSSSPSSSSPVYTLLSRGTKVTSLETIDDILYDLYQLFSLPDVLDLDSLTKQLVREIGIWLCKCQDVDGDVDGANANLLSTLRSRFALALKCEVRTGTAYSIEFGDGDAGDSATVSSTTPHLLSITLPGSDLVTLQQLYPCRTTSLGELYVHMWLAQFETTFDAVRTCFEHTLSNKIKTNVNINNLQLEDFLRTLTHGHTTTLGSLLSPDSNDAKHPAEFFSYFLPIAKADLQHARNKITPTTTTTGTTTTPNGSQ